VRRSAPTTAIEAGDPSGTLVVEHAGRDLFLV